MSFAHMMGPIGGRLVLSLDLHKHLLLDIIRCGGVMGCARSFFLPLSGDGISRWLVASKRQVPRHMRALVGDVLSIFGTLLDLLPRTERLTTRHRADCVSRFRCQRRAEVRLLRELGRAATAARTHGRSRLNHSGCWVSSLSGKKRPHKPPPTGRD